LLDLHDLYFAAADPDTMVALDDALLGEVHDLLIAVGHPPASDGTAGVHAALWDWAGIENLEERVTATDRIDPLVLARLRAVSRRDPQ
jgi:hypothetical protein